MIRCDESKPYVFVSYSHRDSEKVYQIIERMCAEGYNVWYDSGIDPGTEWDENIASHVKGCAYFIAFVSKGYIGSNNCKDELNYARDLDKERLLVYLEEVDLPDGMAMRMNRIQAIWWNKYDGSNADEAYKKLFSAQGIEKTRITEGKFGINKVPTERIAIENMPVKKEIPQTRTEKKVPVWVWSLVGIAGVGLVVGIILLLSSGVNDNMAQRTDAEKIADYEQAVAAGDTEAMYNLGDLYYYGEGVSQDFEQAKIYYEQAAAGGNDSALFSLGELYYYGEGVSQDYLQAKNYYEQAVAAGNVNALFALGYLYENGEGVSQDFDKAKEYYKKAAELGNEDAKKRLELNY